MSFLSDLVKDIVDMPGKFADVAAQGPIEGLLVHFGALFVTIPLAVFGVLVLGALVDLLTPDATAVQHP